LTVLFYTTILIMCWVLYLDRPWIHAKNLVLVSMGIALGLYLHGYSDLLLVGNMLFVWVVLVILPGQIRHEHVKGAADLMSKAIEEERTLNFDEIPVIIKALETSGLMEFKKDIRPLIADLLPKDPKFLELMGIMEGLPRGNSRRLARNDIMERYQVYTEEEKHRLARKQSEKRRQISKDRHDAERADRDSRAAERTKPKSEKEKPIIKLL
jgi:hypothetical protein